MFEYNDDFKEQFIAGQGYQDDLARRIFTKAAEYEHIYQKSCANFNLVEIKELLRSFNSRSAKYLAIVKGILSDYTAGLIANGLSVDNINHYDELTMPMIRECLNQTLAQKYIPRDTVLEYVSQLPSSLDRYYLLATYEGIYGDDFLYAKRDAVNGGAKTISLPSGRIAHITDDLYHIICQLDTTQTGGGDKPKSYSRDEYILKVAVRSGVNGINDLTKQELKSRVFNHMRKIKSRLNEPTITFPTLYLSGLTYKIKEGVKETGLSVHDYIGSPEFDPIAEFYDLNKYKNIPPNYVSVGNMRSKIKAMLDGYL